MKLSRKLFLSERERQEEENPAYVSRRLAVLQFDPS